MTLRRGLRSVGNRVPPDAITGANALVEIQAPSRSTGVNGRTAVHSGPRAVVSRARLDRTAGVIARAKIRPSRVIGAIGHRLPRRPTFVGSFIAVALPYGALAWTPSLPWTVGAFVVTGLAVGPLNPIIMTIAPERIPPELRGRVFGASGACAMAAAPLGVIAAGFLVEWIGLTVLIAIIAACYLVATASMLVNPAIREMDAHDGRHV